MVPLETVDKSFGTNLLKMLFSIFGTTREVDTDTDVSQNGIEYEKNIVTT